MKPKKNHYEDQQGVWNAASKFLLELIKNKPAIKKATVWASLAEGKFGIYEESYRGMEGSDIDLVLVIDEKYPVPEGWHWTKVRKSWFDLYTDVGDFVYKGHKHRIDGLLVFPSRHDLKRMDESLEGRSKVIYERK